jgi:hypothetical protein
MYAYTYLCMYVWMDGRVDGLMCTCMYVSMDEWIYVSMEVWKNVCILTYLSIKLCVCMYICMYVFLCVYVCMYVRTYVCMYGWMDE